MRYVVAQRPNPLDEAVSWLETAPRPATHRAIRSREVRPSLLRLLVMWIATARSALKLRPIPRVGLSSGNVAPPRSQRYVLYRA
jgi:hypothetical protein